MHILIGLGLAIVLLYFWLIGHWFARVLTTLTLGAGFTVLALAMKQGNNPGAELAALAIGFVAGWVVASLPAWYWHHRARMFLTVRAG